MKLRSPVAPFLKLFLNGVATSVGANWRNTVCLYVDYKKTIRDDKTYTFYKVYYDMDVTYESVMRVDMVKKKGKIFAKDKKYKLLPTDGQKAYNKYAKEYFGVVTSGAITGVIQEGLHAFTDKKSRQLSTEAMFAKKLWRCKKTVVVEIEVLGKHIIAFGKDGDVAFTRGKIIGEVNVSNC